MDPWVDPESNLPYYVKVDLTANVTNMLKKYFRKAGVRCHSCLWNTIHSGTLRGRHGPVLVSETKDAILASMWHPEVLPTFFRLMVVTTPLTPCHRAGLPLPVQEDSRITKINHALQDLTMPTVTLIRSMLGRPYLLQQLDLVKSVIHTSRHGSTYDHTLDWMSNIARSLEWSKVTRLTWESVPMIARAIMVDNPDVVSVSLEQSVNVLRWVDKPWEVISQTSS